jgi:DNA polymerase I-like protein with 3'-5' exonuclease and polymerase domains
MIGQYNSGDPYLGCAKLFNMVPPDATKQTHSGMRDTFKVGLLSIQYWIKAKSLAQRLNLREDRAHYMIEEHHAHFPQYWHWSKAWVARACTTGMMSAPSGWSMSLEKPIKLRTIVNWPIQVTGAELFQLACIMATRIGVRIVAPVHDACLIEAREDEIERDAARMRLCFERASRVVLKRLALRTDCSIVRHPGRYVDSRGAATWQAVEGILADLDRERRASIPASVPAGVQL